MSHQIAVIADIRPGKREQLKAELAQGPPFDLADHGFTRHQAFLGEADVVLVFEGDRPLGDARKLAASLGLTHLTPMATGRDRGCCRSRSPGRRPRGPPRRRTDGLHAAHAVGRSERCPGDSCPFWSGGGCGLQEIRADLETNPELAGFLLDLRASAAGVEGWDPFRRLTRPRRASSGDDRPAHQAVGTSATTTRRPSRPAPTARSDCPRDRAGGRSGRRSACPTPDRFRPRHRPRPAPASSSSSLSTRRLSIQPWSAANSSLSRAHGANTLGPAAVSHTPCSPAPTPRCSAYHARSASGSIARNMNPPTRQRPSGAGLSLTSRSCDTRSPGQDAPPSGGGDPRRSGAARCPAMRRTRAAAAISPAPTWSSPGWPNTTPVIVVRLPSIQRMARKAKQPPAASSEPVLTPTNPSWPSSVSVL